MDYLEVAPPETREVVMAMYRDSIITIDPIKRTIKGALLGNAMNRRFDFISEDSEVILVKEGICNKIKFDIIDEDTISFEYSDCISKLKNFTVKLMRK